LLIYVWKFLTCTLRNRMHPTKIKYITAVSRTDTSGLNLETSFFSSKLRHLLECIISEGRIMGCQCWVTLSWVTYVMHKAIRAQEVRALSWLTRPPKILKSWRCKYQETLSDDCKETEHIGVKSAGKAVSNGVKTSNNAATKPRIQPQGTVTLRSYLKEKLAAPVKKTEIATIRILRANHATPLYPQTLALNSPPSGGSPVGKVLSHTQATEFSSSPNLRNLPCSIICVLTQVTIHLFEVVGL
jgi:hypothetical protein